MKKKLNFPVILGTIGILVVIGYIIASLTKTQDSGSSNENYKFELFFKLFNNLDYKVKKWYRYKLPKNDKAVFFLFNYKDDDAEYLDKVLSRVKKGAILFLVGIESESEPINYLEVKNDFIGNINIHKALAKDIPGLKLNYGRYFLNHSKEEDALLSTEKGVILFKTEMSKGTVYTLSENDLFSNRNLTADENNAVFLNNLLKPYFKRQIYFLNVKIQSNPITNPILILFKDNLFYLTSQLIIIGIAFVIWKGKRFGNRIRYNPYERRSLTEHVMAVGLFYQKAKAAHITEAINTRYFKFKLRKLLGMQQKASEKDLLKNLSSVRALQLKTKELKQLINEDKLSSQAEIYTKEKKREEILNSVKPKR